MLLLCAMMMMICMAEDIAIINNNVNECGTRTTSITPSPLLPFLCPRGTRYFEIGPENEIYPCAFRQGFGPHQMVVAYYGAGMFSPGDFVEIFLEGGEEGPNPPIRLSSDDRCPFVDPETRRMQQPCIAKKNVSIQCDQVSIFPTSAQEYTPTSCRFIFCLKNLF